MTERTCDAHVPAGLAQNLSGDGLEGCLRDSGHEAYADHHNGYAAWPVRQAELPAAHVDLDALFSALEAA
jgi:hypothetical protein